MKQFPDRSVMMMDSNSERATKLVYRSPSLTVYGDLRAITQAVAATGMLDGAPFSLKTGGKV